MNDRQLSPPAPRKLLHKRTVTCDGYARDDGLYDIEGHLVDVKTYPVNDLDRAPIGAGEPIHEMWLRLTVDIDLNIIGAEAKTVWGPYSMCGDIAPNFKRLEGLTIKSGFTQKTRQLLGGTQGCTHLVELLGPIATTAFQTIYPDRARRDRAAGVRKRPALIGSCHAWSADSEMVRKRYPEFYTGPADKVTG